MAAVLAALRPEPHRGDQVAAGVVVLAVAMYVLEVRFSDTWAVGIRFVLSALAAAFTITIAVQAPEEGERPRAYQSVLYVASFALALLALGLFADLLGSNGGSGTYVWVGLLLGGGAALLAARRNSAVMTLLAAITYGVVVLAFVDWVFDPNGVGTFRWILLVLVLGYVAASLSQRGPRPRHSVQLVNAAGLATVAIGVTFLVQNLFGGLVDDARFGHVGGGTGWELVLLACGFGLVAYAGVDRERGPAYLGVLVLALFVWIAGPRDFSGASLIGWPIVLLLMAGGMLAIGLRPSHPLPPAPGSGGPPPPPPTPMPEPPAKPATPTEPATDQISSDAPTKPTERLFTEPDPPTEPLGGDDHPTEDQHR